MPGSCSDSSNFILAWRLRILNCEKVFVHKFDPSLFPVMVWWPPCSTGPLWLVPWGWLTWHSGMSSALVTASRYSAVGSRDSRVLDKVFITDRSSSCSDSQKGFNFSDLQRDNPVLLPNSFDHWIQKQCCASLREPNGKSLSSYHSR